jgi:hypothetical protein
MTIPSQPQQQPSDMPGPQRPVPMMPSPSSISIFPVDGVGADGPVRLVAILLITSAGSSFGAFTPEQIEPVFTDALRICAGQRSGLSVPVNGRLIVPGGAG